MTKKDKALIELDYLSWMSSESEKRGYQLNEIGDVVRCYENRMKSFKNKAMRELKENEASYKAGIMTVLDNPDYYGLKRKPKPVDWSHYDAAKVEADKIMNQRAIEIVRNL